MKWYPSSLNYKPKILHPRSKTHTYELARAQTTMGTTGKTAAHVCYMMRRPRRLWVSRWLRGRSQLARSVGVLYFGIAARANGADGGDLERRVAAQVAGRPTTGPPVFF